MRHTIIRLMIESGKRYFQTKIFTFSVLIFGMETFILIIASNRTKVFNINQKACSKFSANWYAIVVLSNKSQIITGSGDKYPPKNKVAVNAHRIKALMCFAKLLKGLIEFERAFSGFLFNIAKVEIIITAKPSNDGIINHRFFCAATISCNENEFAKTETPASTSIVGTTKSVD